MEPDLRAVLAGYPAEAQPREEPGPLGNAGGLSGARLWRFDSARGPLVARAWPPETVAGRLSLIHRWLAEAGFLGFIPVPLADREGRTFRAVSGRLWEVAPWLPGSADVGRPPAMARVRAGFAALGAFHLALARHQVEGSSPGLADRLAELDTLRSGGFDALSRALDSAGIDPLREPALRWLDVARRLAGPVRDHMRREAARVVILQPCLRDARPEHLLFVGDRVAGLVDFGAMGVETVASDLARLLSGWIGTDRAARAEALASYAAVRPLGNAESALVASFERSAALLGGARWVRWHFVEGRRFDDPRAVSEGLRRGLDQLASLVSDPDDS